MVDLVDLQNPVVEQQIQIPNDIADMAFTNEFAFRMIPDFDGNRENIHKFSTCCDVVWEIATTRAQQVMFMHIAKSKLSGSAYNVIKYKTNFYGDLVYQGFKYTSRVVLTKFVILREREMEQTKKHRSVLRSAFTKKANELEQLITAEVKDMQQIQVAWEILQQKYDALVVSESEVYESLLAQDASEEDLELEMESSDVYRVRFTTMKLRFKKGAHDEEVRSVIQSEQLSTRYQTAQDASEEDLELEMESSDVYRVRFTTMKLRFKKGAHDEEVRSVIQSEQLSTRYQTVYQGFKYTSRVVLTKFVIVRKREMEQTKKHRSVLRSAFTKKANELEQLITVEVKDMQQIQVAWGILQQKYDALVISESEVYESLLAQDASEEDLEFNWSLAMSIGGRRSDDVNSIIPEDSTLDSRLKGLMSFLKNEIENEQRISLASEGFGLCSNNVSTNDRHKKDKSKPIATLSTAAGLINCDVAKCVFCGGIHDSEGCFKAQKLSFVQKKNTLSDKKACFRCLKIGHMSRRCRSRLKCVICGKSHVTLMCADLPSNKITPADQLSGSRDKEGTKTENQVLANHTSAHVFLQTLRVKISSGDRTREVRVLIDSGSQRSYVLKSTVLRMGYVPKRTECIRHCLFGGTQTSEQRHNCYDIKLTQDDYSCTLEALDQPKICNEIPSIFYGAWMEELKTLHIDLHDTLGSDPIEILIGADVAGKLYTGRRHILTCGLVAVETLLGWTLMGRIPSDLPNFSTTLTVHSLFVKDATITKLWEL
ncbi:hypothetical protein JTB14_037538 [Gonioctena quinquepunctata]|nr:hypothetical protein JTB14_037538 [Gonioctena quinquepunctata]